MAKQKARPMPAEGWLAQLAGLTVGQSPEGTWLVMAYNDLSSSEPLPTGRYTHQQAWCVLKWLAEAEYDVQIAGHTRYAHISIGDINGNVHVDGLQADTLELALSEAVQHLYESEQPTP